jgi:hypothetical protein
MPRPTRLLVAAIAAAALSVSQATAQADFTWTKLYDSATPLPGTNLAPAFLSAPAISGQNIAFAARYTDAFGDYEGVYALVNGSLARIVDTATVLPDTDAVMNYTTYAPAIHGADVALYAVGRHASVPDGLSPWNAGIYRWSAGTLSRVADEQMNIPGAASKFFDFSPPDIRNGTVIFNGVDEDGLAAGVYTRAPAGPLVTVADTTTPAPGHPATFFGFPYLLPHTALFPDGSALFLGGYNAPGPGTPGKFGIYRSASPGGALLPIAEDGITPIPNGSGTFLDVYTATIADDDGTVVFFGRNATTRGIYAVRNGTLQTLVDNATLLPDASKTFGSFGQFLDEVNFAYNNGVLLFEGYDRITDNNNVLHGLYLTTLDGQVQKLLSPGQAFDGKTIAYWELSHDSLHDNGIGLTVAFTDGSTGIYTTSTAAIAIPEPSALAACGLALLWPRRRL